MERRIERAEVMVSHPLPSEASVAEVRHAVRDRLDNLEIDPGVAFDCLVAVTEACTNALIHGKKSGAATTPSISWRMDPSGAQFMVEDFSLRGWSMADEAPVVESGEAPLSGRVGGFGFHLMADLMDEVNVSIGAAGTRVTMTKHFAAP
jgi:anti-sigma regulatory factor (Ser/Thr protein kinase)